MGVLSPSPPIRPAARPRRVRSRQYGRPGRRAPPPRRPRPDRRADRGPCLLAQGPRLRARRRHRPVLGAGGPGRRRAGDRRRFHRRPVPLPLVVGRRRGRRPRRPGRGEPHARPGPAAGAQPGLGVDRAGRRLPAGAQPAPDAERNVGARRRDGRDGLRALGLRALPGGRRVAGASQAIPPQPRALPEAGGHRAGHAGGGPVLRPAGWLQRGLFDVRADQFTGRLPRRAARAGAGGLVEQPDRSKDRRAQVAGAVAGGPVDRGRVRLPALDQEPGVLHRAGGRCRDRSLVVAAAGLAPAAARRGRRRAGTGRAGGRPQRGDGPVGQPRPDRGQEVHEGPLGILARDLGGGHVGDRRPAEGVEPARVQLGSRAGELPVGLSALQGASGERGDPRSSRTLPGGLGDRGDLGDALAGRGSGAGSPRPVRPGGAASRRGSARVRPAASHSGRPRRFLRRG